MRRILILTTVSGFLLKFEQENVDLLQKMGFEVHYASNENNPGYYFSREALARIGVKFHHIEIAKSPADIQAFRKAKKRLEYLIRTYHFCAIHCHTPMGGVLGREMGRIFSHRQLKIIYTAHGFHFYKGSPLWNHLIYETVERYLAHYTDQMILINQEDYDAACSFCVRPGGHVYQIPGVGLDRKRFSPRSIEQKERDREALGISKDEFLIVSVGELNKNKNHEIVIKAIARLKKSDKNFPVKYIICGEGEYREQLVRLIRKLKLKDAVNLCGYCQNVPEVLGCADVSAFPSVREGLGMAGLEALALGIPLLASENRGTREYLKNGYNGFFCRADDAASWEMALRRVRTMNQTEKMQFKRQCRASTEAFEKDKTRQIMKQVYKDLCDSIDNKK